jgi:hypothetical protein
MSVARTAVVDLELGLSENACNIWLCPTEERNIKELRALTPTEREKVWADLSGYDKSSTFNKDAEDPRKVEEALQQQLKENLSLIKDNRDAFDLAQSSSPEYTDSRSFRVIFLRSNEFNARAAALQILLHFEEKRVFWRTYAWKGYLFIL